MHQSVSQKLWWVKVYRRTTDKLDLKSHGKVVSKGLQFLGNHANFVKDRA